MTDTPISNAMKVALARIDGQAWATKKDLLLTVHMHTFGNPMWPGRPDDFVKVGYDELSSWTGIEPRYAWRCLRELVDGHRALLEHRATRPHGLRINTAVDQWRDVPWRGDRTAALMFVAQAAGLLRRVMDDDPSTATTVASLPSVAPRQPSRRPNGLTPRSSRGVSSYAMPRPDRGVSDFGASRTPFSRAKALSTAEEQQQQGELVTVVEAIRSRTGAGVFGGLVADVAALVAAFGAAAIVEAIPSAPGGLGPPKLVQWLNEQLRASGAGPTPRRDPEKHRRATLQLVANYREIGDEETAQVLLAELEECENDQVAMNGANQP